MLLHREPDIAPASSLFNLPENRENQKKKGVGESRWHLRILTRMLFWIGFLGFKCQIKPQHLDLSPLKAPEDVNCKYHDPLCTRTMGAV